MLKIILFAMIGHELNLGRWYWNILACQTVLWLINMVIGVAK